jgi:Glycine cleavage system T protein (aminomethyltransferase)
MCNPTTRHASGSTSRRPSSRSPSATRRSTRSVSRRATGTSGTDLTALDTPFDSGLGFAVAKDKWLELDRDPPTMLRTLLVGEGDEYLTIYGGEAVHRDGEVVGRIRSAAYGFTVERNVALAKLPSEVGEGGDVEVDVMGDLVPAVVAPTDLLR